MSCSICGSFRRPQEDSFDENPSWNAGLMYVEATWATEPSWDGIVASAQTCACCDAIIRGCRGWLDKIGRKNSIPTRLNLQFDYDWPLDSTEEQIYHNSDDGDSNADEDSDENRHTDDDEEWPEWKKHYDKSIYIVFSDDRRDDLSVHMYAATDDAGNKLVPQHWDHFQAARLITGFTGSAKAFETMNAWIKECVTEHKGCGDAIDCPLPSRVLDVGTRDQEVSIRLVETTNKQGRYAALSHCWGAAQPFKTTIETLSARKNSISYDQLSATFQEAVQVTRALDIRYLWCDSLCIVQDDEEDWAREASKMAAVYQNALVTIAATASNSGDEGLFRAWHEIEVAGQSDDGDSYRFMFRASQDRHVGESYNMSSNFFKSIFPLTVRAWALQERLLSPRILHFTPNELSFECIEEARCECRGTHKLENNIKAPKALIHAQQSVGSLNQSKIWQAVVETYTQLSLTYPSDKLAALGGLAKKFAQPNNRYLAGLWSESLLADLTWTTKSELRKSKPSWRAPSWSWASVDGDVAFYGAECSRRNVFRLPALHHKPYAQVLACDVVPKSLDVFGELESGQLRLSGRCAQVTWYQEVPHPNEGSLARTKHIVIFPNGYRHPFYLDFKLQEEVSGVQAAGGEIVCLLLSLQTMDDKPGWTTRTSLVLRRLKQTANVFERIGLLREPPKPFLTSHRIPLRDDAALYPTKMTTVEIV